MGEDGGLIISTFGEACIRLMTDIECSIKLIKSLRTITSSSEASWNEMQLIRAVALSMNSTSMQALKTFNPTKISPKNLSRSTRSIKRMKPPKRF